MLQNFTHVTDMGMQYIWWSSTKQGSLGYNLLELIKPWIKIKIKTKPGLRSWWHHRWRNIPEIQYILLRVIYIECQNSYKHTIRMKNFLFLLGLLKDISRLKSSCNVHLVSGGEGMKRTAKNSWSWNFLLEDWPLFITKHTVMVHFHFEM